MKISKESKCHENWSRRLTETAKKNQQNGRHFKTEAK